MVQQQYPIVVEGLEETVLEGTLTASGLIGGLAKLYNRYDLEDGDTVNVCWDGVTLRVRALRATTGATETLPMPRDTTPNDGVFGEKRLKHVHIECFAPGNLTRWTPQTEPDVYMVFGILAEYTDYRYVCGTSKSLLLKLGYDVDTTTKPDAILVDADDRYRMAEFKVKSADFASNHGRDDVYVLVCWADNAQNPALLPPKVLALQPLL